MANTDKPASDAGSKGASAAKKKSAKKPASSTSAAAEAAAAWRDEDEATEAANAADAAADDAAEDKPAEDKPAEDATSADDAAEDAEVAEEAGEAIVDLAAADLAATTAQLDETTARIREAREQLAGTQSDQGPSFGPDTTGYDRGAATYAPAADSFAYAAPGEAAPARHPGEASMGRVFAAEFFGAFVLVLAGLGIGMYNAVAVTVQQQQYNFGTNLGGLAVALGFGLGVVVSAYAFGWISGGHFNPAVTLGAALAGRVRWARVPMYWLAQLVGSFAAAGLLWVISRSMTFKDELNSAAGADAIKETRKNLFASVANDFGAHSTGSAYLQFPMVTALLAEVVVTAVFVLVILGATSRKANTKFAPLAIGLTLAVGLMILMPITNGSMNPTRSLAANIFAGGAHIGDVWVFIVGPLVGGALGGLLYPLFTGFGSKEPEEIS